jgi:hypothetical protein
MNTKALEHFITFLRRSRTESFDSERISYDQLKLVDFTKYDFFTRIAFKFLSILSFVGLNGFQSSSYSCTCICNIMSYVGPIYFSAKEKLAQYIGRTYSQCRITLIPVVSSNGMTYANMASVPAEKHNRYTYTYITTYPPSGIHAFNAAWAALHTLQERIHVLRKWQQDIHRSPHALGVWS